MKDTIVGACHRTSDGQEHKIIWRAGPERDAIFHLRVTACSTSDGQEHKIIWRAEHMRVTACREQGSHCHN